MSLDNKINERIIVHLYKNWTYEYIPVDRNDFGGACKFEADD